MACHSGETVHAVLKLRKGLHLGMIQWHLCFCPVPIHQKYLVKLKYDLLIYALTLSFVYSSRWSDSRITADWELSWPKWCDMSFFFLDLYVSRRKWNATNDLFCLTYIEGRVHVQCRKLKEITTLMQVISTNIGSISAIVNSVI